MASKNTVTRTQIFKGNANLDVTVTLRGPIFDDKFIKTIEDDLKNEAINKLTDRMMLTGKRFSVSGEAKVSKSTGRRVKGQGLGVMRNALSDKREHLSATVSSTKIAPRTVGVAWSGYNMAIARSMVPRVINKAAKRMVQDLG